MRRRQVFAEMNRIQNEIRHQETYALNEHLFPDDIVIEIGPTMVFPKPRGRPKGSKNKPK